MHTHLIQLSLISHVKSPTVVEHPSIETILKSVSTGQPILEAYPFVHTVKKIRKSLDEGQAKDEIRDFKLALPKVFPHVKVTKGENIKNLGSAALSGFVHFDVDAIAIEDLNSVSDSLKNLKPYCFFKSPSGRGFKVFFLTSLKGNAKTQERIFKSVWQAIGVEVNRALSEVSQSYQIDVSQKALGSGFFMSYDPEIWINPTPIEIDIETLDLAPPKKEREIKDIPKISRNHPPQPWDGMLPTPQEILKQIDWMTDSKKQAAIKSIQAYFDTKRHVGLRYEAYFKMASNICHLGIYRESQFWTIETLGALLCTLDYDGSRQDKDQIKSCLTTFQKSGLFERKDEKETKYEDFSKHLDSFFKPHKTIKVEKFVSEKYTEILQEIQKHPHQMIFLESDTGSGKTALILHHLINDMLGKIFFTIPFKSLQSQLDGRKIDDRIQYLYEGDTLDPSKKVFICTYEKLLSIKHLIKPSDILVIDEIHLFGDAFRMDVTSQILDFVLEKKITTLGLSASGQMFISSLAQLERCRYLKIECQSQKTKTLKISMVSDAKQQIAFSLRKIEKILEENPASKILFFKNDKDLLWDLKKQLEKKGISSLVVTSETLKTDVDVQKIWDGHTPDQNVFFITKVGELGVEMRFITHTLLMGGQYDATSICQISNRNRNAQAHFEWIISKPKDQNFVLESCFDENFISQYLSDAKKWVDIENTRFLLAYPWGQVSKQIQKNYIEHSNNTLESETPHRLRGLIMIKTSAKGGTSMGFNAQGWIQNVIQLERSNEHNLAYLLQKLDFFWKIKAEVRQIQETALGGIPKRESRRVNIEKYLEVLKEKFPEKSENLLKDVEEILNQEDEIEQHDIDEILEKISYRYKSCNYFGLSMKDYLFTTDADFERIYDLNLIRISKKEVSPIEHAIAEQIKKNGWIQNETTIFQDDICKLINALEVPTCAQHILNEVKKFSDMGKARLFRKLVEGKNCRKQNPNSNLERQRGIIISGIAWENLLLESHQPYVMYRFESQDIS